MAFAPPLALDYLRRANSAGRLAHAYLIVAEPVPGQELAGQLAALVLGVDAAEVAAHPDVHFLEPQSKARRIVIEQVRELEAALQLKATHTGGRKIGIVREADRINTQAANAFLKTLEEPPAQSLLLLITALPESLPETILSRCIKVVVHDTTGPARPATPEAEELRKSLQLFAQDDGPRRGSLAISYGMLRHFTQLLGAIRARLQNEADAAFEQEEARYKKTTDGAWLDDREAYYKLLVDSRYLAERAQLVDVIACWWGELLRDRFQAGASEANSAEISIAEILRRLSKLEQLRENLDRNIQEALALEVAFLEVFA